MIKRLAWDSECFGFEVGMVRIDAAFNYQKFLQESQVYQLVYIFSKQDLGELPSSIKHVDEKITLERDLKPFSKTVLNQNKSEKICQEESIMCLDSIGTDSMNVPIKNFKQQFSDLALISGEYSRFKTDQRLKNKEHEKLYHSWANNALNGNDRGFVFLNEGEIQGMITLTFYRNGTSQIGLLAVLRACRGRGIGSLLLNKASTIAGESESQALLVTTQKANIGATSLYQKEGFKIIDEQNVYHWWRG